jgi:tight adherence protein C
MLNAAISALALVAAWMLALCALEARDAKLRRERAARRLSGKAEPRGGLSLARLPVLAAAAKRSEEQARRRSYAQDLPRMLEVVALGMRSGLGFDQAFALYARRFDAPLAKSCRKYLDVWERGLMLREQGLKELALEIDLPVFTRFAAMSARALRYGASLNTLLLELAQEQRRAYRAEQQELVAKAPVKMLLPTGVLILPAMLLLVMGPILMELTERMV